MMNENMPVIFIHQGNSWYLPYALRQARTVSKSVVLLGDSDEATVRLDRLRSTAGDQFTALYEHMSFNPESFERFCFLRWFYLLSYMQANDGVDEALYLDTDVLLYSPMPELRRIYGGGMRACGLMIPPQTHDSYFWVASGHISYWTRSALQKLCDFILEGYTDGRLKTLYREKWNWHQSTKSAGGICDMTTLYLFSQHYPTSITNLAEEFQDTVFDLDINSSQNGRYAMEGQHKKIRLIKTQPVFFKAELPGVSTRVHGIHFQGQAKHLMPKYFTGKRSLRMYRRELRSRLGVLRRTLSR
jgi:hypothetical protein